MKRIEITRPIIGICFMQVCAEEDVTDEEILEVCNKENPAGTINGWSTVHRGTDKNGPVECNDDPSRTHFMINC